MPNARFSWQTVLAVTIILGTFAGGVQLQIRELRHTVDTLNVALEAHRALPVHPGAAADISFLKGKVERCETDVRNHQIDLKNLSQQQTQTQTILLEHDKRTQEILERKRR